MTGLRQFTRVQWLALKPSIYLAEGYLDEAGELRGDFVADYATAAATQLLAAEVSPQELALTIERRAGVHVLAVGMPLRIRRLPVCETGLRRPRPRLLSGQCCQQRAGGLMLTALMSAMCGGDGHRPPWDGALWLAPGVAPRQATRHQHRR